MAQDHQGLPATSLLLVATALLLFGAGGGLVGYVAGERHGQERAAATLHTLGAEWDSHRDRAQDRFDEAIGAAAARLEDAAVDLKAQVSMYHGCGAICSTIAHQFGTELLRARDAIRKAELGPLPAWEEALRQSGGAIRWNASAATGELTGAYSSSTVIVTVGLLCATVTLCFGIACFTLLKLRATEGKAA